MPRFPVVSPNLVSAPRTSPVFKSPASAQRQGQAMQRLGQALNQLTDQALSNVRESQAAKAVAQASAELDNYVLEIQQGRVNEDGQLVGRLDPSEHMKAYEAKVEEIRARQSESLLDPVSVSMFEREYDPMATRKNINVQTFALDGMKQTAFENYREMTNALADEYVNVDDVSKPLVEGRFESSLARMVQTGVVDQKTAATMKKKWKQDVNRAGVRKLIRLNPDAAVGSLTAGDFDEAFSAEEKQIWIDRANQAKETQTLSRGVTKSDPAVLGNLITRQMGGEDVLKSAHAALLAGKLSNADFKSIAKDGPRFAPSAQEKNVPKQALTLLEDFWPSPMIRTGDESQVLELQKLKLREYLKKNPEATMEDAKTEVFSLVGEAFPGFETKIKGKVTTRYLVGSKFEPDFAGTLSKIKEARDRGELNEEQFAEEVLKVQALRDRQEKIERLRRERENK